SAPSGTLVPCEESSGGDSTVGPRVEGPEFVGKVVLNYVVAPNPLPVERQGQILIGDQVFLVVQQPLVCSYSLSPSSKFHGRGTNSGSFKVSAKEGCTGDWVVLNTNSWITILTGS